MVNTLLSLLKQFYISISNFLESLFGKEEYINCPRCLKCVQINPNEWQGLPCHSCGFLIPSAYMREYKNAPPVFVQLFGLPATGKTTFLDMLRLHLYEMDQVWQGFYTQPMTQLDMDHKAILLTERMQGKIPGSTPKRDRNQSEVYIMYLNQMERWRSRFLVLMDHSGEYFRPLVVPVEEIPFLQHTPVTILLLSLPDMEKDGKRVEDLLNSYITSLERNGVNLSQERRRVIIAFNKADLIPNLPEPLNEYLRTDTIYRPLMARRNLPIMGETALDNYITKMKYISNITMNWVVRDVPGGAAMLNMLSSKGIDACFTVMSATGHELSSNASTLEPSPRRVLDPFFWVLEFYNKTALSPIQPDCPPVPRLFQSKRSKAWLSVFLAAVFVIGSIWIVQIVRAGGVTPQIVSVPTASQVQTSTQPSLTSGQQQAQLVIDRYYTAINSKDYQTAYNLWQNNSDNPDSYQKFANGFADTSHDNYQFGNILQQSDGTMQVDITLTATSTSFQQTIYQGYYIVGQQPDGSWKIFGARIHEI